jgi:hypothetical protein
MLARAELNYTKCLVLISKCRWSKYASLRVAAPGIQTTVTRIALGTACGVNGQD